MSQIITDIHGSRERDRRKDGEWGEKSHETLQIDTTKYFTSRGVKEMTFLTYLVL